MRSWKQRHQEVYRCSILTHLIDVADFALACVKSAPFRYLNLRQRGTEFPPPSIHLSISMPFILGRALISLSADSPISVRVLSTDDEIFYSFQQEIIDFFKFHVDVRNDRPLHCKAVR
jgi:hypothetical protein